MAFPQRLTAQLAFEAALRLERQGKKVSSSSLWEEAARIGSFSTAKKWADLWRDLRAGTENEEYRPLFESIIAGEPRPAGGELNEDPDSEAFRSSELYVMLSRFATDAWEILLRDRKEHLHDLEQTALAEVRSAESRAETKEREAHDLALALSERDRDCALLREASTDLRNVIIALESKLQEHETIRRESREREDSLLKDVRELTNQLSMTQRDAEQLRDEVRKSGELHAVLSSRCTALEEELRETQMELQALHDTHQDVLRERDRLTIRGEALSDNLTREIERTRSLEQERTALMEESRATKSEYEKVTRELHQLEGKHTVLMESLKREIARANRLESTLHVPTSTGV